ncbi:hypothetical protein COLO4_08733 [Corchorus olitorius]|uniref:ADP-ribosyl cyclase/cyclic ADP-ribose hydrolase n=1 Tax=Corchorus olitorius TaxID=93759 RepID=A0A1R3KEW7_9ROSI|nr:hypothetical protein COLO4_08733 [Corchorus olitorius]
MASSSSSTVQPRFQVFLSFRGEDTRHGFTSHLLEALKGRGINVFFDEEKLEKGEELTPALLNAIKASKISIIILSKDYASSKSCLAELSKIMECKVSQGQIVLPIFYRVNPSDVRHHSGSFKESFHQHLTDKPKEVERWKAAFTQVGNLKGWHIDGGIFDRSETEYIKGIVEDVIRRLSRKSTSVSQDLVGMEDQIEKILLLIDQEHIRVIGIWGMGGIGKTSLAEEVYNEVVSGSKFDAHYFLQDVREKSLERYGMQSLQNELLSKLLKGDIHIDTRFIGSTLVQDRLRNVRLFVVFDDVSNQDQIKRLGVEYYGPGSKVIVTSRDRQLLRNIKVDEVHKVEELDKDDSLKLFCKFAFKQDNPEVGFLDLSNKFSRYAGGNPIALKVLGATLYQKSMDEWNSALEKLEEYPEGDIFGPLKISFDGLGRLERNMFLDLACFYENNGKLLYVTNWLGCFYNGAWIGISNLVDKCLVDGGSDYRMHDLLKEMGMDIVRQESEDPGKRSRLWCPGDVYHVLKYKKVTESIKGISLNMEKIKKLHISPDVFEKMNNIVFIKFYGFSNKLLRASQDLSYLPDGLRYFQWDYCPLKSLPSNFDPHNLVVLKLKRSKIEQLWDGHQDQVFVNLKEMNLSESKNIRKIPNLLRATKLETLDCRDCISLTEVPCMTHLISLKDLDLKHCPISKFPEIPNSLNLERLNLFGTRIEEVPSFICKLDALRKFNLSNCPNITELNLNIEEEGVSSIPRLQRLRELDVSNCKSLKSLSGLPPGLERLDASNCISLERVSFTDIYASLETVSFTDGEDFIYHEFAFQDCSTLNQEACGNVISAYLTSHIQSSAKQLAKQLTEDKLDEWHRFSSSYCYLPGSEISDKFENQSRNSSITVKLEGSATSQRFLCFALCLVLDTCNSDGVYSIKSGYRLKGKDGVYQNFKGDSWFCEGYHTRDSCCWNSEETFAVSEVGSSINCSSDEDHRSCSPKIISQNSLVSQIVHFLGQLTIEEGANGEKNDHEDPATTISRLDCKRSFSSDDEEDHEPNKRAKIFHYLLI